MISRRSRRSSIGGPERHAADALGQRARRAAALMLRLPGRQRASGRCLFAAPREAYRRDGAGKIVPRSTRSRVSPAKQSHGSRRYSMRRARAACATHSPALARSAPRAFSATCRFRRVGPAEVPATKWRGYETARRAHSPSCLPLRAGLSALRIRMMMPPTPAPRYLSPRAGLGRHLAHAGPL